MEEAQARLQAREQARREEEARTREAAARAADESSSWKRECLLEDLPAGGGCPVGRRSVHLQMNQLLVDNKFIGSLLSWGCD